MNSIISPSLKLETWNGEWEHLGPIEILQWIQSEYANEIALASSFSAEDVALIDMISGFAPKIPVFILDTGRLHEETHEVMEACRKKYKMDFEIFTPQTDSLQTLLRTKGAFSFRESVDNRMECCGIRKVEPLNRALKARKGWITGLRRGQSITRAKLSKVEIDVDHNNILKFNPLADWSEQQVWNYIQANDVPYNKLHDAGFSSIGCAPCTRAIYQGEDVRAGRWWWERPEHKECGLHVIRRRA
jgi:phosphoadenosine phosphosulfate reductase